MMILTVNIPRNLRNLSFLSCYGGFNGTGATSFYAEKGFYLLGTDADAARFYEFFFFFFSAAWRMFVEDISKG